ncbi:MAG: helix-turn-helix domain-containing protein [Spirochaetaceae bacterium]|jgi:repressor LexA|nr:helix-turn-helix domain-containing protein [Spirochaetaceae bacterium]
MDIKVLFGKRLKQYRKAAGFSQDELAEKLEVSGKHLSGLECGKNFISAELLTKISSILATPPAAFFCAEGEQLLSGDFFSKLNNIIEENLQNAQRQIMDSILKDG